MKHAHDLLGGLNYLIISIMVVMQSCNSPDPLIDCTSKEGSELELDKKWGYTGKSIRLRAGCTGTISDIILDEISVDFTVRNETYVIIDIPSGLSGFNQLKVFGDNEILLLDSIWIYPGMISWKQIADFPSSQFFNYKVFNFKDRSYLMNGSSKRASNDLLFEYSLEQNRWTLIGSDSIFTNVYSYTGFGDELIFHSGDYTVSYNTNNRNYRWDVSENISDRNLVEINNEVFSIFTGSTFRDSSKSFEPILQVDLYDLSRLQFDSLFAFEEIIVDGLQFAFEYESAIILGLREFGSDPQGLEFWKIDPKNGQSELLDRVFFNGSLVFEYLFRIGDLAYFSEKSFVFDGEVVFNGIGSEMYAFNLKTNEFIEVMSEAPEGLILVTPMQIGDRGFQGLSVDEQFTVSPKFFEAIPE